jgi:hypothetical protein
MADVARAVPIFCLITLMLAACSREPEPIRNEGPASVTRDTTDHAVRTQEGRPERRIYRGILTRSARDGSGMKPGRGGRNVIGPPGQSAEIIQGGRPRTCTTRSVRNDLRNGGHVSIPPRQKNEDAISGSSAFARGLAHCVHQPTKAKRLRR